MFTLIIAVMVCKALNKDKDLEGLGFIFLLSIFGDLSALYILMN